MEILLFRGAEVNIKANVSDDNNPHSDVWSKS